MGWSGGNYTKGNNSTGGWTGDASLGIGIEAGRHDTQDNDFATGIDQCLNKDGSNSCTGDLNLGGFKPVNLAAGTAAAPAIVAGGDVNTGIFSPAADQIGIATNGTEKVRINATGQVGINASTLDAGSNLTFSTTETNMLLGKFSADAGGLNMIVRKSRSASLNTNAVVQSGDSIGTLVFQAANGTAYNNAVQISAEVDGTPGVNDMPGRLIFGTTPDGSSSVVTRMQINNAGYVSINDTPDAIFRLRLGGRLRVGAASAGEAEISWGSSSTPANGAWGCSVRGDIGGNNDDLKIFRVNPANGSFVGISMQLVNSNGRVLIAGNTDNGAYNLQCNGSGVWGAGAYVNGSDQRIKEDISPLSDTLDIINALNPVTFRYKEEWSNDRAIQPGFIAQEVESTLADTIYGNGIVQQGGTYLGLAYQNFIPLLVKAVQELNAKVEALEARVAELEAA